VFRRFLEPRPRNRQLSDIFGVIASVGGQQRFETYVRGPAGRNMTASSMRRNVGVSGVPTWFQRELFWAGPHRSFDRTDSNPESIAAALGTGPE